MMIYNGIKSENHLRQTKMMMMNDDDDDDDDDDDVFSNCYPRLPAGLWHPPPFISKTATRFSQKSLLKKGLSKVKPCIPYMDGMGFASLSIFQT